MDEISKDVEWLYRVLDGVIKIVGVNYLVSFQSLLTFLQDDFTRRLVQICRFVEEEGIVQKARFAINRSDYMVDVNEDIMQVEVNTIASSFGFLSAHVSRLHRFLLSRYYDVNEYIRGEYHFDIDNIDKVLPTNKADEAIAAAMGVAFKYYHENFATKQTDKNSQNTEPVILFVVQPNERNSFDQRLLEYELWETHGIRSIRKSLCDIAEQGSLVGDADRRLVVDHSEVSIVYFRAGYTPLDYPSQVEWDARMMIERSLAIKCPCIQYHLVGTKKVQQELAIPGVLERFVDKEYCELLRSTFTGLWSLDRREQNDADKAAIVDAIVNPNSYVIKPQREGGGNNLYGDDVKRALTQTTEDELTAYTLMQRIFPKQINATLVRINELTCSDAIQELGVYGVFMCTENGETLVNEQSGHLLRTKSATTDEGGVASGYSCLDSPFLV